MIDERAESIFRDALPAHWPRNPFKTDYAKDFAVEVFENEEATGEVFIVQLKGKQKLKPRRDGKLVCRLDDDHLNYFHHKLSLPVFLVLVDTSTRDAFYAFVQGELTWIGAKKPGAKSGRIEVDQANTLRDENRLLSSVREAWKYMREKFPGSVEAAADLRRKTLESLDPRFSYDLKLEKGRTKVSINPIGKPVDFKLRLHGKKETVAGAWSKLLDFGEPLEASDDLQISISGSPLFAEHGGVLKKVEYDPKLPCQITITAVAGEHRQPLPVANSLMVVARRRFRVSWKQPECPLSIELVVDRDDQSPSRLLKSKLNCKWKPTLWRGKPLTMVPWLECLNLFLTTASVADSRIDVDISVYGNSLISLSSTAPWRAEFLSDCAKHTDFLVRAKRVEEVVRLGMTIPKRWRRSHFDDVCELHQLFATGRAEERRTVDFRGSLLLPTGQPEPQLSANDPMTLNPGRIRYTIWGKKFWMEGACFELNGWKSANIERNAEDSQMCRVALLGARQTLVWTQCPWPRPRVSVRTPPRRKRQKGDRR